VLEGRLEREEEAHEAPPADEEKRYEPAQVFSTGYHHHKGAKDDRYRTSGNGKGLACMARLTSANHARLDELDVRGSQEEHDSLLLAVRACRKQHAHEALHADGTIVVVPARAQETSPGGEVTVASHLIWLVKGQNSHTCFTDDVSFQPGMTSKQIRTRAPEKEEKRRGGPVETLGLEASAPNESHVDEADAGRSHTNSQCPGKLVCASEVAGNATKDTRFVVTKLKG
jgi:hypothetical protein